MGSDGGSEPPAIPFLPHLKHKNLQLSQNYKAAFDTGIGASPFGGHGSPRSAWSPVQMASGTGPGVPELSLQALCHN